MGEYVKTKVLEQIFNDQKELKQDRDHERSEHLKAERFIVDLGYRRCDIPACNCDSWHKEISDG